MRTLCILLGLAFSPLILQAQPKALFYMTSGQTSVQSFLDHADKIDILVPAWYSTDVHGMVWGGANSQVMQVAREHHVAVMPIIGGSAMGPAEYHQFFNDEAARHAMDEALVRICKQNGYLGIQFDFEDIDWQRRRRALEDSSGDRGRAACGRISTLDRHRAQCTWPSGETAYSAWMYRDWRGAYDLKALAQSVDLICLMTYDQHTAYTPPGPVAGYPWVLENLKYALAVVPKDKLSLGIPVYGYHWFAGEAGRRQKCAEQFRGSTSAHPQPCNWRMPTTRNCSGIADDKTAWFYFYRAQDREYIFYTDARTFAARYDLVKQDGLEGFCSWVLGEEDPAIWQQLPSHDHAAAQSTSQPKKN